MKAPKDERPSHATTKELMFQRPALRRSELLRVLCRTAAFVLYVSRTLFVVIVPVVLMNVKFFRHGCIQGRTTVPCNDEGAHVCAPGFWAV